MFIQGDESQIATADFFFFSFLHKLLFCAKNSFCALGNYRDQVRIIKVGANVRREQLQQAGSCFRMAFNSKQNHPCRFYTPTPQLFIFTLLPLRHGQLRGNELLWWPWRLPPRQGWKQSRRCCGWISPVCGHDVFYPFHAAQERIFWSVTMRSDNRRRK